MPPELPLALRPREPVRLLVVGDLTEENDFALFLRVFADVAAWLPTARAILLGEGPARAELEVLLETLSLRGKVGLPGPIPGPRLMELTQRAHVAVFHGTHQGARGIPPALPVAMAGGVCVVGTRGGVADSLVDDGRNGLLVDPGDAAGLSRALHLVITNADLRRHLGETAAEMLHGRGRRSA